MKPEHILEDLLRAIVNGIGQNTPNPEIEWFPMKAEFSLRVNGKDQGRFVGKSGSVIWAIQTVMWYAGLAQLGTSAGVALLEPLVVQRDRRPLPFRPVEKWDKEKIIKLINSIMLSCFKTDAVYVIEDISLGKASLHLNMDAYLQTSISNPSLPDAIATVLHAAGMANGVGLKLEYVWR